MIHRAPQPDAPLFVHPADPNVRPQDVAALGEQAGKVLRCLLSGPATVPQLEAASGGRRIGARVYDLNEHFRATGDTRRIEGRFLTGRVYEYRIVGGGDA